MTKDIVAPPGGVMTDEVGTVTGDLTLEPIADADGTVCLRVQYKDADEWYKVTDAEIKVDPNDANAVEQAKQFTAATDVTAIAVTKLDGTAKGGVVLAIANQFKIPVKFIGVGEKMTDLLVFDKHEFVDSLFDLEK